MIYVIYIYDIYYMLYIYVICIYIYIYLSITGSWSVSEGFEGVGTMTIDESKAVRYCGSPDPGSAPRRGTSCEVEIIWGDVHPIKPFFRSFRLCAARVFKQSPQRHSCSMSQGGTYFAKDQLLVPSSPLRTYNYPVGYLQALKWGRLHVQHHA